jgi:hypothetical protein
MPEFYCARVDDHRVVLEVIVCGDVEWARATHPGTWVDCGTFLPGIGDVLPDPVP